MSLREHDGEPVRGLPEPLPAGEHLLWQGAPDRAATRRHVFHLRMAALYFGAMLTWQVAAAVGEGGLTAPALLSTAGFGLLTAMALGLIALLAWLVSRTTVYTITSKRVVMRIGIALSMTANIPFRLVDGAAVKRHADGTGDLLLRLAPEARLSYIVLWPHAKPWSFARPAPMLRAVPDAERVAQILARALAAAAELPVPAMLPEADGDPAREPRASAAA